MSVVDWEAAVLADAETVTVPLPVPEGPLVIVSHGALLEAVQPHHDPVVTATVALPPAAGNEMLDGDSATAQAAAGSAIVSGCPAMVAVELRAPPALAAALNVTVPLPVPDAPPVTVTHESGSVAVHEHQLSVVTVIVAVPPLAVKDWLAGEML
jgi:hypothetical protein